MRPPPRRRRYGEVSPEFSAKAEASHATGLLRAGGASASLAEALAEAGARRRSGARGRVYKGSPRDEAPRISLVRGKEHGCSRFEPSGLDALALLERALDQLFIVQQAERRDALGCTGKRHPERALPFYAE